MSTERDTGNARAAHVLLYGQRVGVLEQTRGGQVVYRHDGPPLGLRAPGPATRGASPLPLWFENLLPESGSALRTALCNELGIGERQSFRLLVALGEDLPGAVQVVGGLDAQDSDAGDGSLPVPGQYRFSLAGMQLKYAVTLRDGRYALPVRGHSSRFIAKFPSSVYPGLPQVEHATMRWAAAAGFDVPATEVVRAAALDVALPGRLDPDGSVFIVERYDRRGEARVHQEDAAQALGLAPDHKYGDSGSARFSYDTLGRFVADQLGAAAAEEFVRRVAFVVASGNGDAHLKNWSFLREHDGAIRWSPLYDQVCTANWNAAEPLALALGRDRSAHVSRERVEIFAARSGVSRGVALFYDTLERIAAAWPEIESLVPDSMRDTLRTRWAQVPCLRAVGSLR